MLIILCTTIILHSAFNAPVEHAMPNTDTIIISIKLVRLLPSWNASTSLGPAVMYPQSDLRKPQRLLELSSATLSPVTACSGS